MKNVVYFIGIVLLSSCVSFLDKEPLNFPSDENFLSNEEEMNVALADCYSNLWINFSSVDFPLAFDMVTDIAYSRGMDDMQVLGQGSADANNQMVLNFWTVFYKGISKCNYLINNMKRGENEVSEDIYKQIESEARFLRALYYSYLVELFGDVPLIKENQTLEDSQIARTDKKLVVDFIIEELKEASKYLSSKNNPTNGRATKGAALAILARIALYNERWNDAIEASNLVMQMEGTEYMLEDDYSKLFTYDGQTSKEIIFSIQYLSGQRSHQLFRVFASRNAAGQANRIPSQQIVDSWECIDGLPISESPLYNPKNPFMNRDPRLGYSVVVPGSEFLGFQYESHGDSTMCWNYTTNKRIKNQDAINTYASFTGYCWRKYVNIEDISSISDCDNNLILIRYPEVLLTYAEAKIRLGEIDESVFRAINKVRQRVNMPPITTNDPNELFYAVCRERKYEFAMEGLRLFDIRRWRIAENVMNEPLLGRMKRSYPDKAPLIDKYATPNYVGIPIANQGESADFKLRLVDNRKFNKNRDYLWPIPDIELKTNKKLVQNPNY